LPETDFHERHRPDELGAELAKRHALDGYANRLAEFEGIARAFSEALTSVVDSMAELARMAAQVEAKRRKLAAESLRLKDSGIFTQGPRVAGSHARLVMNAARSGHKATLAAIATAAKERSGKD
jgi:hypothetical protein